MPPEPNDYALYVLPRKDMDSLNHAGKMAAQVAHAANHAAMMLGSGKFGPVNMAAWGAWEKSTPQGFGTTIVYGGLVHRTGIHRHRAITLSDIRMLVEGAAAVEIPSGIVTDPTYPLLDGDTLHTFSVETCGWLFGARKTLLVFIDRLVLHPATANFATY